ncbi:hypothetical protein B5F40_11980 [Gordonibacter sp. An230]|uniref:hypothetical protein n=1 Tax=Gordonibacter sp. An230 TaxID=1965592 RepID=UPI000B376398|nr:hypothetical protein [Gordonibacter sp. An230]OUO88920.1 hypothetical protein B5F40_11980 [Gordonibacter sp. An230]
MEREDDPVLFEARPRGAQGNVYGRYRVVTMSHARKVAALFCPVVWWAAATLLALWLENGGVWPGFSTGLTRHHFTMYFLWPVVPILSPAIIVWFPVFLILSCSESFFVGRFSKCTLLRGYSSEGQRRHLSRSGERHPARVEARRESMDVLDGFSGVRVPKEAETGRRGRAGRSWMRLPYGWITCAWRAEDMLVLRFCWGEGLECVWDVVVDPATFVKGDADALLAHLEPRFRFKRTSYNCKPDGPRQTSDYASPNVFFWQFFTKLYRVRWPKPPRRGKRAKGSEAES